MKSSRPREGATVVVCLTLVVGCGTGGASQAELRAALLAALRGALLAEEDRPESEEAAPNAVAFDRLLEKGHQRRDNGRCMLAVSAYVKAIKLRPDCVKAYLHCGATLDDMGDRDRAVAMYEKVLQLDPKNVEALCLRGRARLLDGDEISAKVDFERATGIEPDGPLSLVMLGLLRHLHSDLEGAAERYEEAWKRTKSPLKAGGARGMRWFALAADLAWRNLRLLEEAGAGGSRMLANPSFSPLPPSSLLSRERMRLVGDINFDGTADLMLSDSTSTFGTGGGRFTVWLASPDSSYERIGSFFANIGSVSVEKVGPELTALHTYSHMSAGSGHVSSYLLAENSLVLVQRRMVYPGIEEGSKEYRRHFGKTVAKPEISTTDGDRVSWAARH